MSFNFHFFSVSVTAIFIFLFLFCSVSFAQVDSIGQHQSINEGTSLVSKQGMFELGFFQPGKSTNRYLGIWFKKISDQIVVWVANRCKPINDSSGLLMINGSGDLVLSYQNNKTVVWSQSPSKRAQNSTLQLLDSGNLVLRDESGDYLWQSFDSPSDTLLSGMKFGWDFTKGLNRNLSAWKNWNDPCHGGLVYSFEIVDNRYPEAYMRRGNETVYRTGPLDGLGFSGLPELNPNQLYNYSFVYDRNELYSSFDLKNASTVSTVSIVVLNQKSLQRFTWSKERKSFTLFSSMPRDECDKYGLCGANGNCLINENPLCQCLKGFRPKNEEKWGERDWSDGCVRNSPPNCEGRDGFFRFSELKMPDTINIWFDDNISFSGCRDMCLKNCSCTAYSNSDIRGKGNGCRIWLSDLVDVREVSTSRQDLYIRVSASEIENEKASRRRNNKVIIIAIVVGSVIFGGLLFSYFFFWKGMRGTVHENSRATDEEDLEVPLLKLETLISATDNFALSNKVGEGGFGPVYKGKLEDGQEIAVKRLSSISHQGMNEFRNEVTLIAKLQHRNLVKVLGCCIHGVEKLLVYEYMPNNSLDFFIFGQAQTKLLKWPSRFQIICGIARGLMYLHQDSRLRIIHRDLKASNILLDNEMNPKISDFGLARTFGGDQAEVNTNRIVGTHGYMAPEYAYSGLFSTKSDVFSFGTLVLEIVSGKRSMSFHHENHGLTLIGHAWTLLKERRATELIDTRSTDSNNNLQEVLRCIHIGLLCVQQRPIDRPHMSSVILMLSSDESVLPEPKPPGYFVETNAQEESSATNSLTITWISGR